MQLAEVMSTLESLGTEQTRKVMSKHGLPPGSFGVLVADLKKVGKTIKGDQALALQLFATGNGDAQYLAGLVADGRKMTREQLDAWALGASWSMISEYSVAWVASESPFGRDAAVAWIESPVERVGSAGWATYGSWVSTRPDHELDLNEISSLLDRVASSVHTAPNRVRYCMNGFVIAVGAYVEPLLAKAKSVAAQVGKVKVDLGGTACKVPLASEYIAKVEGMGRVGKKRKEAKC